MRAGFTGLVIDTNIWIDYFRRPESPFKSAINAFLREGRVRLTEIIKMELLSGSKNDADYTLLEQYLFNIPTLETTAPIWEQGTRARFLAARRGHQTTVPDVLIAASAHHYGCELWTLDRQFDVIHKVLPYKRFFS